MSLENLKNIKKKIGPLALIFFMLTVGLGLGHVIGYNEGIDSVQRPEYSITMNTLRLNHSMYNDTYYMLTRNDMRSDNWVLDLESRDDYFIIGISIEAESASWSRFFVSIKKYDFSTNVTIELISVTQWFSSGSTYIYNFYDGAYGGTLCDKRATIYFLGYGGVMTDIGEVLSSSISIRGYYEL